MAKYRKKPVVVEAMQFTDGNWLEVVKWITVGVFFERDGNGNRTIRIPTLEGDMTATLGDYIIKGVEGEFYPCKPEIFAKTYEAVEETKPDTEKALCLHMSTMTEYAPKRTTCLDCGEEAPL